MDKTTQRLMPGLAAPPSQKWILQYSDSIPNTGYLPFRNSAMSLLAISDTTEFILLGQGTSTSTYIILDNYGNITSALDSPGAQVEYTWPNTLGQYASANYYLGQDSYGRQFNANLTGVISRTIVDNALDASSNYSMYKLYQNGTFIWSLGERYTTSTTVYSLTVAMFNSANVTQWIRNIAPPTSYNFGTAYGKLCQVSSDMEVLADMYDLNGTLLNKVFTAKIANVSGTVSNQRLIGDSTLSLVGLDMVTDATNKHILVANANNELVLLKISNAGVVQWQKKFVNSGIYFTAPNYYDLTQGSIALDSSGNTYVVQRSNYNIEFVFIKLTKIDSSGNIVFSNIIAMPALSGGIGTYLSGGATILISGSSVVVCATYYDSGLNPTNLSTCFIRFLTTDSTLPVGTYDIPGQPSLSISTDTSTTLTTSTLSVTTVAYTTSSLSITYLSKTDYNDFSNFTTSTVYPAINKVQLT